MDAGRGDLEPAGDTEVDFKVDVKRGINFNGAIKVEASISVVVDINIEVDIKANIAIKFNTVAGLPLQPSAGTLSVRCHTMRAQWMQLLARERKKAVLLARDGFPGCRFGSPVLPTRRQDGLCRASWRD